MRGNAVDSTEGMDHASAELYLGEIEADWAPFGRFSVADARSLTLATFGAELSPLDIARAVGAPGGSRAIIYASDDGLTVDVTQELIGLQMQRWFLRDFMGLRIYHAFSEIKARRRRFGARILARAVNQYRKLGATRIDTYAMGGPSSTSSGYAAWPALGFSLVFSDAQKERVEAAGFEAHDTLELFTVYAEDLEGRRWWEANGSAGDAHFLLDEASRNSIFLTAYLRNRDIQLWNGPRT